MFIEDCITITNPHLKFDEGSARLDAKGDGILRMLWQVEIGNAV